MATAGPAGGPPGGYAFPPGINPATWANQFTTSAVGGGNPYSPAQPGQGIPTPMVDPNAMGGAPPAQQPGVHMVPGFGPIMSGYIDQFNTSLGNSRAAINSQMAQALGELGQRRDAAAKVVAGIPGEVSKTVSGGQASFNGAAKAGLAGLDPGAAATMPIGQGALSSALGKEAGDVSAEVPFLNLANMANSQGGAALIRQQGMIGQQNLDDQQRQFMGQMDMAQLQNIQSKEQGQTAYDRQKAMMQFQSDLQSKQFAQQEADAAANQFGIAGGSKQLNEIKGSPAYEYAKLALSEGLFQPGPGESTASQTWNQSGVGTAPQYDPGIKQVKQTPQQIIDKYKTSNPDILRALAAEGLLPASQVASALNGPTTSSPTK